MKDFIICLSDAPARSGIALFRDAVVLGVEGRRHADATACGGTRFSRPHGTAAPKGDPMSPIDTLCIFRFGT